jgi:hypothetical protein
MTKALRLRKEALTELTTSELSFVAGADQQPTPPIYYLTYGCPTRYCVPLTDACITNYC